MILVLPPDTKTSTDNHSTMKHRSEEDVRREHLQSLIKLKIACRNVHFVRPDMLSGDAVRYGEIIMVSRGLLVKSDKDIVERVTEAVGTEKSHVGLKGRNAIR